jgi:hypothetical protein
LRYPVILKTSENIKLLNRLISRFRKKASGYIYKEFDNNRLISKENLELDKILKLINNNIFPTRKLANSIRNILI